MNKLTLQKAFYKDILLDPFIPLFKNDSPNSTFYFCSISHH